jgi:DnaJ domain
MNANSSLFDRIRIKPARDDKKQAAAKACEHPGCTLAGDHKAPKGRGKEGQYWHFCKQHAEAYNKSYNYFNGMSDDAVAAFQKDASIGHRPTWKMGVERAAPSGPKASQLKRDWDYADPLGILHSEGIESARSAEKANAEKTKPKRRHGTLVLRALDTMGLDASADAAAIKVQFKALVKRFHPDTNGGDRSFEDRLREIIKAHDTLRAAGLC